jgi:hypothetical protein
MDDVNQMWQYESSVPQENRFSSLEKIEEIIFWSKPLNQKVCDNILIKKKKEDR